MRIPAFPLIAESGRSLASICSLLMCTTLFTTAAEAALPSRIVAANGAGADVYAVNFSGSSGTISKLNTDSNAHTSIRSLVFRSNELTGTIDILAADTPSGELLLYLNGTGNSQVIWKAGSPVANPLEGAGPVRPDGLSLDGSGNLYVASSAQGSAIPSQLWVFPRRPGGPLPGGFGLPRLVDDDFGSSLLVETLSVRTSGSIAAPGTLLVLTESPAQVFAYTPASLQSVLGGAGETAPSTLIAPAAFPAGTAPGGMDIWPLDGSLLITSYDRVLRYASGGGFLPPFATGLGQGVQNKFKIRTAREGDSAIAVVADNSGGQLLKFSGPQSLVAVVTSGVQRPQALASTNAAVTFASCYSEPGGCDLLGGVLKHRAFGAAATSGFLLQEPCVVISDPRYNATTGTWSDVPLPINSVCPGFGDSVIPAYLRGGSGASGKGFAIVNSVANFLLPEGSTVISEAETGNILGNKPVCTSTGSEEIVTWAPTEGEGTIVEGNQQLDVTIGCYNPLLGGTRGASDWAFGLVFDVTSAAIPGSTALQKFQGFAAQKYGNLLLTIESAQIQKKLQSSLAGCVSASRRLFDRQRYADALKQLTTCDQIARDAWSANPAGFQSTAANPNPFGEIVTRIANLDYTISYRLLPAP